MANEKLMYDGAFSGLVATEEMNRSLDEVYGFLEQAPAGEAPPQVVEVFDPARESESLMDLSAAIDVKLLREAGRSWMPERR